MRRDEARLLDVLLACREALEFIRGVSRDEFLKDRKLQTALCMELEIIGEAARSISDDFKISHPEIPWRDIVSLRHRIVHEYFRLDLETIWQIAQRDVPDLMDRLEPLVPPEPPKRGDPPAGQAP